MTDTCVIVIQSLGIAALAFSVVMQGLALNKLIGRVQILESRK